MIDEAEARAAGLLPKQEHRSTTLPRAEYLQRMQEAGYILELRHDVEISGNPHLRAEHMYFDAVEWQWRLEGVMPA